MIIYINIFFGVFILWAVYSLIMMRVINARISILRKFIGNKLLDYPSEKIQEFKTKYPSEWFIIWQACRFNKILKEALKEK
jgi:hypothetical protein